ncbi:DUF3010 family protein [Psychromonas arctica]|uniref:DUF3010 family protein n=1 Tax=Psychromonas arctica TaxID=168275 RepID=A0ABU9HEJ3_9GAMM|nr:DUF3010 family protein [Psychromonas sp. L1A2]
MRVCGVELTGNEAVIAIMQYKNGLYDVPPVRTTKLTLNDPINTEPLKKFQFDFAQLMKDYQIDKVIIRERALKGKFAGHTLSFKIEGALQLMQSVEVQVISSDYIKQGLKQAQNTPTAIEVGLKKFQEQAMLTAFGYLQNKLG